MEGDEVLGLAAIGYAMLQLTIKSHLIHCTPNMISYKSLNSNFMLQKLLEVTAS